jgi:hypothetical protein
MTSIAFSADTDNPVALQATGNVGTLQQAGCEAGPKVIAVNAGKVVLIHENAAQDRGMGNTVILEHVLNKQETRKIYSLYAHLDSIDAAIVQDAIINKGGTIGKMGASGGGDPCFWVKKGVGVHLHFELKDRPVMTDSTGTHYRFTPSNPNGFGYFDPNLYIGRKSALDIFSANGAFAVFGQPTRSPQEPQCLYASDTCQPGLFHAGIDYDSKSKRSFDEQFTGTGPNNWTQDLGKWKISDGSYVASSEGLTIISSTSTYNSKFSDFVFSARMRRAKETCRDCSNKLLVRAGGELDSTGHFANGYVFAYTKTGWFTVTRNFNGGQAALQNWKFSKAIRIGNRWNTLKVVANKSQLSFFINGRKVWSGVDATLAAGFVGVGMYADEKSEMMVDWAQLKPIK